LPRTLVTERVRPIGGFSECLLQSVRNPRRHVYIPKKRHSDRDSAGKILNSNFSVCRMTVSLALTPICSPTKILCR
jgi:hypothetical protein